MSQHDQSIQNVFTPDWRDITIKRTTANAYDIFLGKSDSYELVATAEMTRDGFFKATIFHTEKSLKTDSIVQAINFVIRHIFELDNVPQIRRDWARLFPPIERTPLR